MKPLYPSQVQNSTMQAFPTSLPCDLTLLKWQMLTFVILVPDSPMKAHCWSEEDKKLMVERVRQNRTGLQNRKFRKDQVWDAVTDPQGKAC